MCVGIQICLTVCIGQRCWDDTMRSVTKSTASGFPTFHLSYKLKWYERFEWVCVFEWVVVPVCVRERLHRRAYIAYLKMFSQSIANSNKCVRCLLVFFLSSIRNIFSSWTGYGERAAGDSHGWACMALWWVLSMSPRFCSVTTTRHCVQSA